LRRLLHRRRVGRQARLALVEGAGRLVGCVLRRPAVAGKGLVASLTDPRAAQAGDRLVALSLRLGKRRLVSAPVQLIYVADLDRPAHTQGFDEPRLHEAEMQRAYCHIGCGLIAGNVGLFAAATGLAAWFDNCDRLALHTGL